MNTIIEQIVTPSFSPYSFAFQKNKGVIDAVTAVITYFNEGYTYTVDIDIEDYFNNIDHNKLLEILTNNYKFDKPTIVLIANFLKCDVSENYKIKTLEKGILQGSILSPVLSNVYLNELDKYLEKNNIKFCRYADDLKLFTKSHNEAVKLYENVICFLYEKLNLKINKTKSGIYKILSRAYLGCEYTILNNGLVETKKIVRKKLFNAHTWKATAIENHKGIYHLIGDGILRTEDYIILFENKENKVIIPSECTEIINVYSDIIFSKSFFEIIDNKGINVNFFNKNGNYIGSFIPYNGHNNNLAIKQLEAYTNKEKRLLIAKNIIIAATHNIRENIRYYYKHDKSIKLAQVIDKLTEYMKQEDECQSVDDLMLIEARMRQQYYSCFNYFIMNNEFESLKYAKKEIIGLIEMTDNILE